MQFGVCSPLALAEMLQRAGFDYLEASVQSLLQGETADQQWQQLPAVAACPLSIPVGYMLVPGHLKIAADDADPARLRAYMQVVLSRAGQVGMKVLVFGSGGARHVPDSVDRRQAFSRIVDFLRMAGPIAQQHHVTIVIEPLKPQHSNVINTVTEALTYIQAVDHPHIRLLVDAHHFWVNDEPLDSLARAMPWIEHVHVADRNGRVAPGLSGQSDYVSFFRVIKQGGYDRRCSIEIETPLEEDVARPALVFLKEHWALA